MKRIALIIPYFGEFPNYFNLWLESVKHNQTIDFFIITDSSRIKSSYKNVHFIIMSFKKLRDKIQELFDFDICLNEPYKLTDYKPAYGKIFNEYIKKFDFWGYCDIDLIFGDIRSFVTDDLLDSYEKLYKRGHFTLFKNDEKINNLFCENHQLNTYRFDEVYTSNYACHFDEIGICDISDALGIKTYYSIDYSDVLYNHFSFILYPECKYIPQIFRWKSGKLFRLYVSNGVLLSEETMYIHLQKRPMTTELESNIPVNSFLIVPNQFLDDKDISINDVMEHSKRRLYPYKYKLFFKHYFENIKNGAISQRIHRYQKHLRLRIKK